MHETIKYTGSPDARCPVTLAALSELELAVAFRAHPNVPYEALALAQWLSRRRLVPHTNMPCDWRVSPTEIIASLDCCSRPAAAALHAALAGSPHPQVPLSVHV